MSLQFKDFAPANEFKKLSELVLLEDYEEPINYFMTTSIYNIRIIYSLIYDTGDIIMMSNYMNGTKNKSENEF